MVVGWYHSHPGFGCWLSGVDINTQQSFESLSDRAVAVVVDPIQSVKGKVKLGFLWDYLFRSLLMRFERSIRRLLRWIKSRVKPLRTSVTCRSLQFKHWFMVWTGIITRFLLLIAHTTWNKRCCWTWISKAGTTLLHLAISSITAQAMKRPSKKCWNWQSFTKRFIFFALIYLAWFIGVGRRRENDRRAVGY